MGQNLSKTKIFSNLMIRVIVNNERSTKSANDFKGNFPFLKKLTLSDSIFLISQLQIRQTAINNHQFNFDLTYA